MAAGEDRGGYIFLPVIKLITDMGLRKKSVANWTKDEVMQVKAAYQDCFDEFQNTLARVSENRCSIYIKEHVHFLIDPTTLSEYVFGPDGAASNKADKWTLEQFIDSSSDDESPWDENEDDVLGQHCMTLRWTRLLYDWYCQYYAGEHEASPRSVGYGYGHGGGGSKWPIVLDADDIMADPKLAIKYSRLLGMDSRKISFSWEPATADELSHLNPATKRYLDTLLASGGVLKGKMSGDVDLDRLAKTWRKEFGYRTGQRITQLVKAAMPDYEFLKSRRLLA
ncbi:hypothetical protein K4F52_000621 [Lecanicillium sp. MT-2017a]|nr:hypothetical protein K4F52_000621 [Lecanicillium sp. MT-2017a]